MSWDTYHDCGQGIISWYFLAEKIMELIRQPGGDRTARVTPLTPAEYPTPAKRPVDSALDCSRIHKPLGIDLQPWPKGLEITIRILLNAQ